MRSNRYQYTSILVYLVLIVFFCGICSIIYKTNNFVFPLNYNYLPKVKKL